MLRKSSSAIQLSELESVIPAKAGIQIDGYCGAPRWIPAFAGMTTVWVSMISIGLLPSGSLACAVCFGNQNSAMTQGMNMGILALLGFILPVLGGFAFFVGYLVWRSNHPLEIDDGMSYPGQGK